MEEFEVLGTRFHACTYDSAVDLMESWVEGGRHPHYVCVSNVFDVRLAQRSVAIRGALAAAHLVVPDGMPIVWAGRALGHDVPMRIYGPTLMWTALRRSAQTGRRHFLYGSTQETLARLVTRLSGAVPGLLVSGVMPHPFRDLAPDEEEETLDAINRSGSDYLWVGIGTERQLVWMHRYHSRLRVPVIVGVGAAFAFHAGLVPQAPAWMQDRALEWLYRLTREPRRLWRRYLVVNPPFLWHFGLEYLRARVGRRRRPGKEGQ